MVITSTLNEEKIKKYTEFKQLALSSDEKPIPVFFFERSGVFNGSSQDALSAIVDARRNAKEVQFPN